MSARITSPDLGRLAALVATPARVLGLAAVLIFTFLAAVHVYLSPPQATTTPGIVVPEGGSGKKLLAVFIDGIAPQNLEGTALPTLKALKSEGFYAEVEPCYDRLTVPCLHEAFTGTVNSGLLGAWRNLVSNEATRDSNLFADLAAQKKTIGVIHHGELGAFRTWFTEEYRGRDRKGALKKQVGKKLDLIVYHYVAFDEAFHKNKPGTAGYSRALVALEAEMAALFAYIPPEYTWVIFGDHGHNEGGRHILGLDVPTVFMAPESAWGKREWEGRMPIATLRYLLGTNFGILPPPQYEGADLAPLLEPGSKLADAASTSHYDGERKRGWFPWWGLVAAVGLLALALRALPPPWRVAGALGGAVAGVSGAAYPYWVPLVHATRHSKWFEERVLYSLTAVVVLGFLFRRGSAVAALAFGLCFLALPGTLYEYGLFQNVPVMLGLATTTVLALAPRRRWAERIVIALAVAYAAYLLSDVTLGNFVFNRFRRADELLADLRPVLWGAAAALLAPTPRRAVDAFVLAALGAAHLWKLHEAVVATLTLLALWSWVGWPGNRVSRAPEALPIFLAWLCKDIYESDAEVGIPLLVLLAGVLARASSLTPARWFRPAALALLLYVSLAMTAGLRTNGLDFGFALKWFPGAWHERLWPLVGAAMVVKALSPATLILRADARVAGEKIDLAPAILLRAAAGALFCFAMFTGGGDVGRARVIELVEDEIAWLILLVMAYGQVPGSIRVLTAGSASASAPAQAAASG